VVAKATDSQAAAFTNYKGHAAWEGVPGTPSPGAANHNWNPTLRLRQPAGGGNLNRCELYSHGISPDLHYQH